MSTTPGRGGGGGGGRKRDKVKGWIKGSFRGSPSSSQTPIQVLSPNTALPLANQNGMIFPLRGPRGAKIVMLTNGTWNDALRAKAPSDAQTNI
ncbi:hypothetical protein PV05_06105 [Exophiala xenobiotica]|uniref:Uncharacterized protein n=1 Tax=Exophiala xenobiotica TaxID=348802 RepID=A0A0D2FBY7_9EURO|nr:uncharacterized protein PV05_06105 [Exophiala xenobiotica]KIW57564.1 hypothetical protein PV05_06105 [Exophiala xenobiotica]